MVKKRKSVKRSRKRNTAIMNAFPKSGPMPKAFTTTLRYCEYGISVNPGAGLAGEYIFRANDVFDPNQSGVGHQPRGFDQLMPLFNHFTVIGSRIRVSAVNDDENVGAILSCTLQGEGTTQLNPIDHLERQDVKYAVMGPKNGSNTVGQVSMNCSVKRFFRKTNLLDDPTLRGDVSTSPTEQAYYHIGVYPHNGTTDLGAVDLMVLIDYIVTFHEPNDVASS